MPPSCLFIVLSLSHPLVVSSHQLDVASPPVIPPSRRPLAPLLSRCLAPAGCCVNSRRTALSSSCHATSLSSCHLITALPCHLIAPAGCCVASHRTALSSSSHLTALWVSCSGWLLRQLLSRHPLILLSCLPLVLLVCAGWLLCGLHQTMLPPPVIGRTSHRCHRRHYRHCCCPRRHCHHRHRHHHRRYHRCQTRRRPLPKKEATAAAPPAYQRQHQCVNIYKSGHI
jgi:hypothetical protein